MTLWEGEHLRFGACVVDVQSATISFTSWQARLNPCSPGQGPGSPSTGAAATGVLPCAPALCHLWGSSKKTCGAQFEDGFTGTLIQGGSALFLQETDTQRSMLQALLLQADPAEASPESLSPACSFYA